MVREFGYVIFISDAHALGERGILPFFLFVFFVAVTVQRVYQSCPPEGFIINLEILVVFVQQRRPQAGIGHQDTVDRMYHTVFHGVVFQFVDDGGTPVGIQCIPLAFENEWQVQFVVFLLRFGQVVSVHDSFYDAGSQQRIAE